MNKLIWHKTSEHPVFNEEKLTQILVFGLTRNGRTFSVCELIDHDIIYTPLLDKTIRWSNCLFTHWAYLDDNIEPEG